MGWPFHLFDLGLNSHYCDGCTEQNYAEHNAGDDCIFVTLIWPQHLVSSLDTTKDAQSVQLQNRNDYY